MIKTQKELEDELRKHLDELYKSVSQKKIEGADPNKTQQQMDRFLIDWSSKLTEEREEQIKRSRTQAQTAHAEIGTGSTVIQERDRALKVIADIQEAEAIIKDHILQLRNGMIKAVQNIDKGQEPDFVMKVGQQVKKEMGQSASIEDVPVGKLTPEHVRKLKAAIGQLREKDISRDSDPTIDP